MVSSEDPSSRDDEQQARGARDSVVTACNVREWCKSSRERGSAITFTTAITRSHEASSMTNLLVSAERRRIGGGPKCHMEIQQHLRILSHASRWPLALPLPPRGVAHLAFTGSSHSFTCRSCKASMQASAASNVMN